MIVLSILMRRCPQVMKRKKEAYNKAVAVNKRVASAETLIEQNETAISLRATKTELNALVEGDLIVNG